MTTTSKIILWAIGILIVGLAIYYYFAAPTLPAEPVGSIPSGIACTMDAKQCPDGSYVGRTGPKCEFVCPSADASKDKVPVVNGTVDANGTVNSSPADIGK